MMMQPVPAAQTSAAAVRKRTDVEQRRLRKERAEMLKRWSHKREGTPETHEAHSRQRAGAIARLYASGHLSDDELAWSQEIAAAAERIMADAGVRTASLETRVDTSRHGDAFREALFNVWMEMAYSRWRAQLRPDVAAMALDIIVRDVGLTRAAAAHGMHARRARRLLSQALGHWARLFRDVRKEVSAADLVAAHAGLL
ncbi:MAG: hypothetical protein U9R64_12895 [Pseudomonadota bacterium]|nr:hypothetical protein [Pseudomonadota bacterium]